MRSPKRPIRLVFFTTSASILNRRLFTGMFAYVRTTPGLEIAHLKTDLDTRRQSFHQQYDGVLVARTANFAQLKAPQLPAICVGSYDKVCAIPRICDDQEWMGTLAARHLVGRGLKNFAYCGYKFHAGSNGRQEGFEREIGTSGHVQESFDFSSSRQQDIAFNSSVEQAKLCRWLSRLPSPCGIFSFSDAVSMVLMQCCARIGRPIPDDLALLSVDDDPFLITSFPQALSSISPGSAKAGFEAAKALHEWIAHGAVPAPERRVRNPILFGRQTTGRYHADDQLVARLLDLVDSRIHAMSNVAELCAVLGCSRRTLERRVRRCIGITVHEVITRERLERIKTALMEPSVSVKAVAANFGFSSPQQFGAAFRQHTGVPQENGAWSRPEAKGRAAPGQPKKSLMSRVRSALLSLRPEGFTNRRGGRVVECA